MTPAAKTRENRSLSCAVEDSHSSNDPGLHAGGIVQGSNAI